MNILFLVMSFLLIFVFLNASILKNAAFFSSKQLSSCNYMASKRTLQSKFENYKYKTHLYGTKKEPQGKKQPSSILPKKMYTFTSHRLKSNISSLGKWNLTALLYSEKTHSFLVGNFTENLFIELYGHTSFWKKAEEQVPGLAHAIVKSFTGKTEANALSDLFPEEILLQDVFYKMLKGSGTYNILLKEGYPPLDDFFCFQEEETKVTHLAHAAYPILKAVFQDAIVESILSLEKHKWDKSQYPHSIKKEELQELCKENALRIKGKRFQEIEPLLHFSRKNAKLDKITVHNEKAHIHLQMPIP